VKERHVAKKGVRSVLLVLMVGTLVGGAVGATREMQ